MSLPDMKFHEIMKIHDYYKIKETLAKCAIILYRWGDHEISLQLYEERMKSSSQKYQLGHPGETSVYSEAEIRRIL